MSPIAKKKKITTPVARKFSPRAVKSIEVKPSKPVCPPNPSLRLYRRIAGSFIAVVVILLATVVLLSTTKAIIRVTPQPRTVEASFLVDVIKEGTAEGKILGTAVEQTFEQSKTFPVIGVEQKEVLAKSGGTIKIINNSSKTQPLVATTRLLSSSGVLFRLDKGVTVPAGGSVDAAVHADQDGPIGDIEPDKFTIPGLSTSLQSSIYGESSTAMAGGRRMVSVVSQEEIDGDVVKLTDEVTAFAQEQLQTQFGTGFGGQVFSSEILLENSDTKSGEEKDSVTISLKIKVTGVFYGCGVLNDLVFAKLYESLEDGFIFANDNVDYQKAPDSCVADVEITQANAARGTAELRVTLKKDSIVSNTNVFLQPEVLVGKTSAEVKDYLVKAGLAKDVSVIIFPPWNSKVPSMLDQVTVQVVE
ncbi:MAG: hypothetical protein V1716_04875 [Candidatus Uhrbacteria bacterium]